MSGEIHRERERGAQTSLNEEYREDLTLEEAETMAVRHVESGHGGEGERKKCGFCGLKRPDSSVPAEEIRGDHRSGGVMSACMRE